MIKGQKVKVMKSKNQVLHEGEFLGFDELSPSIALVGVTKTSIDPNMKPKDGKKYISIFRAKVNKVKIA